MTASIYYGFGNMCELFKEQYNSGLCIKSFSMISYALFKFGLIKKHCREFLKSDGQFKDRFTDNVKKTMIVS